MRLRHSLDSPVALAKFRVHREQCRFRVPCHTVITVRPLTIHKRLTRKVNPEPPAPALYLFLACLGHQLQEWPTPIQEHLVNMDTVNKVTRESRFHLITSTGDEIRNPQSAKSSKNCFTAQLASPPPIISQKIIVEVAPILHLDLEFLPNKNLRKGQPLGFYILKVISFQVRWIIWLIISFTAIKSGI